MNILIIPSWYSSDTHPLVGVFFREQARLAAKARPDWNVGISLWGSHEPKLWINGSSPLESLIKLGSRLPFKPHDNLLEVNCAEFFTPAHTWSRRIRKGNITGIIKAHLNNMDRYKAYFGDVDVIHAHVSFPAGAIAQGLSRLTNIPYIITEHMSPFPAPSFKNSLARDLLPQLQMAQKVLSVGSRLSEELSFHGIESEITKNFIDLSHFKPEPKHDHTTRILTLGRLEPQKNYQTLLSVLGRLTHLDWSLRIIGDGSELSKLRKQASALGISHRVDFLGIIDQNEVRNEMQKSSFFVSTSKHESFGVAVLEALACGKPIIMTNTGGVDSILPDFTGLIVESDEQSLVQALEQMINQYQSYDVSKIRGFVEDQFSPQVVCNQLEQIYLEVRR